MLNPPTAFAPFAGHAARRIGWALDRAGDLLARAAIIALALLVASAPCSLVLGRVEPTLLCSLLACGCFTLGLLVAIAEQLITGQERLP
jgi:hypothetical protein